jgi:hypothetical protein
MSHLQENKYRMFNIEREENRPYPSKIADSSAGLLIRRKSSLNSNFPLQDLHCR